MSLVLKDLGIDCDGQRLLDQISITIPANTFVAVLGPSGIGKSTLISCLRGSVLPASGKIFVDSNIPLHDSIYKSLGQVGTVTQEDLLHHSLTVYENLFFSGKIRLPSLPEDSLIEKIEVALSKVGLSEHKNKPVAVLSGGQRKRVSSAIELLMSPRLLLLDEPTSGLDPGMQAQLLEMLRGLTRQGTTVLVTIHSLENLQFFDHVLLIGPNGNFATVCYFGPPASLLPSFKVHYPADLFEKLGLKGLQIKQSIPPSYITSRTPGFLGECHEKLFSDTGLTQIKVIIARSLLVFYRDKGSFLTAIIQPIFLAFIIVISQFNQDGSIYINFFLIVASFWLGMTLTVRELVKERKLFVRDRMAGLLPEAYLLGKTKFGIIIGSCQIFLLWFTARILIPIMTSNLDSQTYYNLKSTPILVGYIAIICTCIGGIITGLILSTLSRTERTAISLLPLILLPQMLFSRVAYGDGSHSWFANSPYQPISSWFQPLTVKSSPVAAPFVYQDTFLSIVSLPVLTRPGTAALELSRRGMEAVVVAEWAYLGLLLFLHAILLYFLFVRKELNWQRMVR